MEQVWGVKSYRKWHTLEDTDRSAALLGSNRNRLVGGRKAGRRRRSWRQQEKALDKQVKDFLIAVETQRRERGMESMTANTPNKTEAKMHMVSLDNVRT